MVISNLIILAVYCEPFLLAQLTCLLRKIEGLKFSLEFMALDLITVPHNCNLSLSSTKLIFQHILSLFTLPRGVAQLFLMVFSVLFEEAV